MKRTISQDSSRAPLSATDLEEASGGGVFIWAVGVGLQLVATGALLGGLASGDVFKNRANRESE